MKKLFLVLVAAFAIVVSANAQSNALGVRLGGGQGFGAELSYQRALKSSNRLEFDLGWSSHDHYTSVSLNGIYQFTGEIGSGFGWFAGVGAHVGFWTWKNEYIKDSDSDVAVALVGQAGLEYKFSAVPIQLSLDIRPRFYLIPDTDFHWGDIALGIRYCF